jgi:glutathione S-transferase
MILYDENNPAPNPRRVRIFLAEKAIDVPRVRVELRKREHKSDEHRARNSLGQIPTLELDDGIGERLDLPLSGKPPPGACAVRRHGA